MLSVLQEKILQKYQAPVSTAKDCRRLAADIKAHTNRAISEATLRRFFGLLKSKTQLSQYSLDTLAIYCGYADYQSVSYRQNGRPADKLGSEIARITRFTLKSIQKKCLTDFGTTIPRQELIHSLDAFIKSEAPVFLLHAPGGYGKSIALAHWVLHALHQGHQVLFMQAELLAQYSQQPDMALHQPNNMFARWQQLFPGEPLILVVDAWDEIATHNSKQEVLLRYLDDLVSQARQISLKIILSVRSSLWKNFSGATAGSLFWRGLPGHSLPEFANEEIRQAIELFNKQAERPIIYEQILWDLLELLRVPFNFYLYTRFYQHQASREGLNQSKLLEYFFRVKVFESEYAEEMEDLLWYMIAQISDTGLYYVCKKVIKDKYPVHIKRETRYYRAYQTLLALDILEEERVQNKYGLYTTLVQFKHQNYYYFLTALDIIRQHGGLSARVLKDVVRSDKNWEWKANVVAILFELAYNNEDFAAIQYFCNLPDKIHNSLPVRYAVGKAFRHHNSICDQVVKEFACYEKGQRYYFEQFVDTNYLYNNYTFRIQEYLQHKHTPEARMFGNAILFLAGFLKLSRQECDRYITILTDLKSNSEIHPWVLGRKAASMLMYNLFVTGDFSISLWQQVLQWRDLAYAYRGYFSQGLVTFELPLLVPLVMAARYAELEELLQFTTEHQRQLPEKDGYVSLLSKNQNSLPELVLAFVKEQKSERKASDLPGKIESALLNLANSYDDFQYQIILRWLLRILYRQTGNNHQAAGHLETALQLSRFAGYDFFTYYLQLHADALARKQRTALLQEIGRRGFNSDSFLIEPQN